MPNHVTNFVCIMGQPAKLRPLVSQLVRLRFDKWKKHHYVSVDFNAILPMPQSLNIVSGSQTNLGMAAFSDTDFRTYASYRWFPEQYPGVTTKEQLAEHLKKSDPQAYRVGQIAHSNIEKYGCPTWYEWCCRYWGTKWGAYDAVVLEEGLSSQLFIAFDTAWSSPHEIFRELENRGFEVACKWYDEGGPSGEYGDPEEFFEIDTEEELDEDGDTNVINICKPTPLVGQVEIREDVPGPRRRRASVKSRMRDQRHQYRQDYLARGFHKKLADWLALKQHKKVKPRA